MLSSSCEFHYSLASSEWVGTKECILFCISYQSHKQLCQNIIQTLLSKLAIVIL